MTGPPCTVPSALPEQFWEYFEQVSDPLRVRLRVDKVHIRVVATLSVDQYCTAGGITILPHTAPWVVYEGPWPRSIPVSPTQQADALVLEVFPRLGMPLLLSVKLKDAAGNALTAPRGSILFLPEEILIS